MCGLVVWSVLHGMAGDAADARDRWGRTTSVWVVTRRTARGEAPAAVATDLPLAMVPDGAVAGDEPLDAVAAHDLAVGDVIDELDIARPDDAPVSWVVMAVPAETAPSLVEGDRVAVFGSGELLCDGIVAAPVADVDGRRTVDVALPPACAADLSAHLANGLATLGRRT